MSVKDFEKMYRTAVPETFPMEFKIIWDASPIELVKSQIRLRYGTNPNQKSALYVPKDSLWERVKEIKSGKEGLSQTNISDADRAFRILKYFDKPACAVMKHLIPSGLAISRNEDLKTAYVKARDCDPIAAFGGVIVFNKEVDEATANEIATTFVEVVAAPSFTEKTVQIFKKKKNLRVLEYQLPDLKRTPKYSGDAITQRDI